MSQNAYPELFKKLENEEYRHAYVSAITRHRIALQIRALRKQIPWSQKELGNAANKPQNVISRLEDPSYGKVSVQTLLDLAKAFDVALIVRFTTFRELVRQADDISPQSLTVPSFTKELSEYEQEISAFGSSLVSRLSLIKNENRTPASATEALSVKKGVQPAIGAFLSPSETNNYLIQKKTA